MGWDVLVRCVRCGWSLKVPEAQAHTRLETHIRLYHPELLVPKVDCPACEGNGVTDTGAGFVWCGQCKSAGEVTVH